MTPEAQMRAACRRNPGAHVLVLLAAGDNARLALAVGDGRRVYAMTCPQPEDMYAGFARVEGNQWGSINGPALVWAHDDHPHEMAAFIGPPEAVINV